MMVNIFCDRVQSRPHRMPNLRNVFANSIFNRSVNRSRMRRVRAVVLSMGSGYRTAKNCWMLPGKSEAGEQVNLRCCIIVEPFGQAQLESGTIDQPSLAGSTDACWVGQQRAGQRTRPRIRLTASPPETAPNASRPPRKLADPAGAQSKLSGHGARRLPQRQRTSRFGDFASLVCAAKLSNPSAPPPFRPGPLCGSRPVVRSRYQSAVARRLRGQ